MVLDLYSALLLCQHLFKRMSFQIVVCLFIILQVFSMTVGRLFGNILSSNHYNYSLKYHFVGSIFNLDAHLSYLAWYSKVMCHHKNTVTLVKKQYYLKPHPKCKISAYLHPQDWKPTFTNSVLTEPKVVFPSFCMCILALLLIGPRKNGDTCSIQFNCTGQKYKLSISLFDSYMNITL